jgi:hypothetical protein
MKGLYEPAYFALLAVSISPAYHGSAPDFRYLDRRKELETMTTKTKDVPLAVLRLLAKWAIQSVRIVKKANRNI